LGGELSRLGDSLLEVTSVDDVFGDGRHDASDSDDFRFSEFVYNVLKLKFQFFTQDRLKPIRACSSVWGSRARRCTPSNTHRAYTVARCVCPSDPRGVGDNPGNSRHVWWRAW